MLLIAKLHLRDQWNWNLSRDCDLLPFQEMDKASSSTDAPVAPSNDKDQVVSMTPEEFFGDIKSDYAKQLGDLTPEELYDNYNPGPNNPDGTVNFECHCVGHLVASPCGYEFRNAISCQKATSDEELEKGACGDELMDFMRCAMRTECFKARNASSEQNSESAPSPAPEPSNSEGN
uniref:CHCH domain-containing protein n=1 Tax=Steinernema glaseri TaxID=37863 RepID=A0A1I7Y130_9BILA